MMFCDIFSGHCIGKKRFVGFLADWYQRVATISCDTLSTPETCEVWKLLTIDYHCMAYYGSVIQINLLFPNLSFFGYVLPSQLKYFIE